MLDYQFLLYLSKNMKLMGKYILILLIQKMEIVGPCINIALFWITKWIENYIQLIYMDMESIKDFAKEYGYKIAIGDDDIIYSSDGLF